MSFLVTLRTKSYQILSGVIAQTAPRLNMVNLKTHDATAPLATPAVSIQHFAAKLAICFRIKLHAGSFGTHPSRIVP